MIITVFRNSTDRFDVITRPYRDNMNVWQWGKFLLHVGDENIIVRQTDKQGISQLMFIVPKAYLMHIDAPDDGNDYSMWARQKATEKVFGFMKTEEFLAKLGYDKATIAGAPPWTQLTDRTKEEWQADTNATALIVGASSTSIPLRKRFFIP